MNRGPEILSAEEDLRRQIAINESQLYHLHGLAKADTFNLCILFSAVIVMTLAFFFFLLAFLLQVYDFLIRPVMLGFSGVICVFLVIGIWETAKAIFSTQMRVQEIKMLIKKQEKALEFAESTLRTAETD